MRENKVEKESGSSTSLDSIMSNMITIEDMDSELFTRIIDFIKYYIEKPYRELPKPLPTKFLKDVIDDEFYLDFIGEDWDVIKMMFEKSLWLGYQPLISLFGARMGAEMKDKEVEEIRSLFGLENDFDEEEWKEVQNEVKKIEEVPVLDTF
mmetsp:Transcript_23019/g.25572  ORF Transcript_23019/g.25572 Transcript_23019/m.25572 type:complete len:151 (+) Transcript_23019:176-628(+)|eukprot:CAMPEP_0205821792 /NCGR_PEP_ID=MMETSP0206-20130828/9673_1 /ASSEMBLY_ACC=CAM_ASM_000279 /TAXON_ID=36767 /ORGANISM="Euplotes focardii, Strain TN1" /LENGTH=150 /DNA_ID=CAMNT_0053117535 /DNA_START=168 /DNA_END=620 /DNA_ORIENTATION=+